LDHIKNSPKASDVAPPLAIQLNEPNDLNKLSQWDIDFRQIQLGPMNTTIKVRSGQAMSLLEIDMSRAVHQTGVSPKGQISIGLPSRNSLSTWQGQDTKASQLISFGNSQEFDGVGNGKFHGLTISIDEKKMERVADRIGSDIPNDLRKSAKFTLGDDIQSFIALNKVSSTLLNNPNLPFTQGEEETVITNLLIAATSLDKTEDKSCPKSRDRAVLRAIDMMISFEKQSVTISQICQEIGASWRTLDRAFLEKFGIGPKHYYMRMRLNRVRSDLLHRADTDSVSDIVNDWGYWHLGQFANDYYTMFGELPSKTVFNPN